MARQWCYFLFMFWFSYLIVTSILLFTNGFLLSRVTQKNNSTCLPYLKVPCVTGESVTLNITNGHEYHCSKGDKFQLVLSDINSASRICLPQKSKVILVVIDALRYDFTTYDVNNKNPLPYENKLPIIEELLKNSPASTRLYEFIADPPTTTMQRLNALTTGSLPTFIDAGSNFATSEINEDNIIDQLIKYNHKIVFMGDDTWTNLYPKRFTRSYPYPSFNVWDLDTVDEGVIRHLYPELQKSDWSLLIAHFLGVDHCGHRYGPQHPEMSRKLSEMNNVIENLTANLSDDSILFVIGDHGMTATGDHGGSSDNEITSAMFVYSKQPLVPPHYEFHQKTVKQVDIVPTLATILGVPIPFSNLGSIVLSSLPLLNNSNTPEWQSLLYSSWANVEQIVDYIKEYAKTSDTFNRDILDDFYNRYADLKKRLSVIKNENDFVNILQDIKEFVMNLRGMCEEVWVQFDSFSMSRGLLLLFLTTFFVYIIVDGIPRDSLSEIFKSSFLVCSYVGVLIAAIISSILYYFNLVSNLLSNIYFSTGIVSLLMLAMLVIQNWEVIALHWYSKSRGNKIRNLFCRLTLILSVSVVFSNSYIIEEAYVLLFLLITMIFTNLIELANNNNKNKIEKLKNNIKTKIIAITLCLCLVIRFSMYFWICREEQRWCLLSYLFFKNKNGETNRIQWTFTVICLALLVTMTRNWLRSCGNLTGYSITVTLVRYSPTVIVVCTGGFWVLHRLPKDMKHKLLGPWQPDDVLARVVYVMVALGILITLLKPLCIYILPKTSGVTLSEENVIPKLFTQIKGLFNNRQSEKDDVPIVCGLATVYSAVYVTIGVYVCLLLALLLGDGVAVSAIILFLTALLVAIIIAIARLETITDLKQLFNIPNVNVLLWFIMSHYFFYATSHQPTFPNISWEAAFIGTGTLTNNFIPATLIIINTFGSYILAGLLLPLLLITPFTLFVMMPSVISKKKDFKKDFSRGEILLYEQSEEMTNSAFTVCCKYIICHCLKVFASMLSATIHCRHLMVWKIFAPKFIFESVGLLVTLTSVLISYLILLRINNQVNRLVISLNNHYS